MTNLLIALLVSIAAWLLLSDPSRRLMASPLKGSRRRPQWLRLRFRRSGDQKQHSKESQELPEALEFLAVCVDAGLPVSKAVALVAEVSGSVTAAVLRPVARRLALGLAPAQAWETTKQHQVWGRVAGDVIRSERSGLALSGTLRAHADEARSGVEEKALASARKVGVRSVVPLMACFLPAFVLIGVVPIVAGILQSLIG